jgi:hypothetical protein
VSFHWRRCLLRNWFHRFSFQKNKQNLIICEDKLNILLQSMPIIFLCAYPEPCCGSESGTGSGSEATKIDIFVPFFVLKSFMNTKKYMLAKFYFINMV